MKLHLYTVGAILLLLSVIHIRFPWHFKWKTDFQAVSLINKQMMYVHTFFISIGILLMGVLCLLQPAELITTNLGNNICIGMGVFWALRLFFQLFVYSPLLWRGKRFETIIHVFFTLIWIYFTAVFLWIGLRIQGNLFTNYQIIENNLIIANTSICSKK